MCKISCLTTTQHYTALLKDSSMVRYQLLSWSMAFTLQFLSDLGKVNLGRVYMPAEVYCLFKVLWRWVMALNDYLDALLQGYCSAPASKQAHSCLFEFSILYCHVSFACLQLMPSDWSFPSAFLLPRARSTHTHSLQALLWKEDRAERYREREDEWETSSLYSGAMIVCLFILAHFHTHVNGKSWLSK